MASYKIRGLHVTPADGALYVVAGTNLLSVSSSGGGAVLGTIGGSGRVGMADNGTQLCVVDGNNGYIYDIDSGFEKITDTDFPRAETVTFMDGYFIFNNSTSGQKGQFFISSLLDGTSYDALDFATAERYPDNLKRVYEDHNELLLFGQTSIEFWYNSGAADFPFAPVQSGGVSYGLGATWSVASLDNTVLFLDDSGVVRRFNGYTPIRISTHAIEYQIKQGDWTNADAYSYKDEGHEFYCLTVPNSGTFVYDAATQLWHERKSYGKSNSIMGFYAYAYGKHITGDRYTGKLYEQSLDTYAEDDTPLVAEMIFPPVQNDGDRFIVHSVQLDAEVGVGTYEDSAGTEIQDPQVMMDISRDGRTWDKTQPWRSMGKVGEYEHRIIWRRLGQYRSFTPKFTISAGVKRAVFTAYANIEPCD